MFKKKATRKAMMEHLKRDPSKDVTDWCTKNYPCPAHDVPQVPMLEIAPRPTTRDVDMLGIMPFNVSGRDLSDCVLEQLDMRLITLQQGGTGTVTRDVSFAKATLVRTSFKGSTLQRVSFEGANLELAVLNSCILSNCNLSKTILRKTSLFGANLESADLKQSLAPAANFSHSKASFSDFQDCWCCNEDRLRESQQLAENIKSDYTVRKWEGAQFNNAQLKGCDFRRAKLCGCDFSGANLTCACLQEADLRGANFSGAKLCGANLSRANMQGVRNLEKADLTWSVVLGGVTIDQDLDRHKDTQKILSTKEQVEKYAQELSDVNFSFTDLSKFNLEMSSLISCLFKGADLRSTNFSGADLQGADFTWAEMFSADFSGANLTNAVFKDADMRSCNLSGMNLAPIQDTLLEAKSIMCMTCTLGNVPDVLKARGVIDNKSSQRVNRQALQQSVDIVKQRRKIQLEEEQLKKQAEADAISVDKLEDRIQNTTVPKLSSLDFPTWRLRLLSTVLKERTLNCYPTCKEEEDERWHFFDDTFGISKGNNILKKLYLYFIGGDVRDDWIVKVWRRTKDVRAHRLGTLENMCMEKMISTKEWASWWPDVVKIVEEKPVIAANDATLYIQQLFRVRPADDSSEKSGDDPMSYGYPALGSDGGRSPGTSPPTSGSGISQEPLPMTEWNPAAGPTTPRGESVQSAPGRAAGTPPIARNIQSSPAINTGRPPPPPPRRVSSTGINQNTPPAVRVGPPPSPGGVQYVQNVVSPPGRTMMQPSPMAGRQLLVNSGVGSAPGTPVMGRMMSPQQQQMLQQQLSQAQQQQQQQQQQQMLQQQQLLQQQQMQQQLRMQQMNGGRGSPLTMSQQQQQQLFMMQRQQMMASQGRSMPMQPVQMRPAGVMQRVKCVECNMVMEPQYIQIHKRECRYRMVSCAICKYSMRYVLWDSHNQYCNATGPCPICKKNIKDNMVVHLYSTHIAELTAQGFFRGAEPPVRNTS